MSARESAEMKQALQLLELNERLEVTGMSIAETARQTGLRRTSIMRKLKQLRDSLAEQSAIT